MQTKYTFSLSSAIDCDAQYKGIVWTHVEYATSETEAEHSARQCYTKEELLNLNIKLEEVDYPIEAITLEWDFEVVASDQVVRYVTVTGATNVPGYESWTEFCQDHGLPALIKELKKQASKQTKEFKYTTCNDKGYQIACLAAAHGRA